MSSPSDKRELGHIYLGIGVIFFGLFLIWLTS